MEHKKSHTCEAKTAKISPPLPAQKSHTNRAQKLCSETTKNLSTSPSTKIAQKKSIDLSPAEKKMAKPPLCTPHLTARPPDLVERKPPKPQPPLPPATVGEMWRKKLLPPPPIPPPARRHENKRTFPPPTPPLRQRLRCLHR